MNILALETSCEHASVALSIGGDVRARALEGHSNHSERLLGTIRELLDEADLSLARLDAIAFGAGPGAFTGVRLACGVAQGLAMGAGLGLIPVSSLAALAGQVGGGAVLSVTDARMGEVYAQAFRFQHGVPESVLAPVCVSPARLELPAGSDWQLIGSGLLAHPSILREQLAGRFISWREQAHPHASEVAMLARAWLARDSGCLHPPETAAPLYVRNKVALTTAERLGQGGRA